MTERDIEQEKFRRRTALVDIYAGKALQGLLAAGYTYDNEAQLARKAFSIGHAMCRERALRISRAVEHKAQAAERAAQAPQPRDTVPVPPPSAEQKAVA